MADKRWRRRIKSGAFQNDAEYDGTDAAVNSLSDIKRCGRCTFEGVVKKGRGGRPVLDPLGHPQTRRCKIRSCTDPYCWIHAKKERKLRVKPSSMVGDDVGRGLFAASELTPAHTRIEYPGFLVPYRGVFDQDAYHSRYGVYLNRDWAKDAKMSNSGMARYANACRAGNLVRRRNAQGQIETVPCRSNAKFIRDMRHRKVKLRPTRTIMPGEELFAAYGQHYWHGRNPPDPARIELEDGVQYKVPRHKVRGPRFSIQPHRQV